MSKRSSSPFSDDYKEKRQKRLQEEHDSPEEDFVPYVPLRERRKKEVLMRLVVIMLLLNAF